VVLGHVVNFFQLCPLALSTLAASYAFVEEHLESRAALWTAVRSELDTLAGFIFLVEVDLWSPWLPWAICSDSCEHSSVVHARPVDPVPS
jgi:hypothetical protein